MFVLKLGVLPVKESQRESSGRRRGVFLNSLHDLHREPCSGPFTFSMGIGYVTENIYTSDNCRLKVQ